jgi:hypothetical protein
MYHGLPGKVRVSYRRVFVGSQVSGGTLAAQRCPTGHIDPTSLLCRSDFDPTSARLGREHVYLRSILSLVSLPTVLKII